MFEKHLQSEGISIVAIGKFNPPILHPQWLAAKGLIREAEANTATVGVVHNEISTFKIDDWCTIEFTKDKAIFRTNKKPYFDPVKDLVNGIFTILPETPIEAFGINITYEVSIPKEEQYYEFGNIICPLNLWKGGLSEPRLAQIEVIDNLIDSTRIGYKRIKLSAAPDAPYKFGIDIVINNHFECPDKNNATSFRTVFLSNYSDVIESSRKVVAGIYNEIYSKITQ